MARPSKTAPRPRRRTPRASDDLIDPVLTVDEQWRAAGWTAGPRFLASMSIVRVEEIIRSANASVLRPFHLTHSRHAALARLYFAQEGEMPMTKLSQHLMVHPTSVTATVDALERYRLVKRVPHPTDRRTTLVRITDKGRQAIEATSGAMVELGHHMHALTEQECLEIFRLLQKVRASAGEVRPRAPDEESD